MFGLKPFRYLSSPVRIIFIINAVVFGLVLLGSLIRVDIQSFILSTLALQPVHYERVWHYLTYAFIHVTPVHFIFNMLVLWMFGDEVVYAIGQKRFWFLYLFSGIFAGLFSIPFYLFGQAGAIIGASGALFGVLIAYGKLYPDRMILLFFIIPMKIKHAIWVLILIDVLLSRTNDSVAHFTHLGGVIAGFIFMYFYQKGFPKTPSFAPRKQKSKEDVLEGEVAYLDQDKQLDMILEKISKSGVNSLSPSEKEYLIRASEKRRRRR
ncbi:MAG: rhomboid family intramembrane serine protease [Fibrobacter sp.]|jgi:membrane associated rhomboid family serine protease|nr:rhomboid family intramembrane serine protease [Fibrobacter sp.]